MRRMRALLATRLSVLTDESTSPERQKQITTNAANARSWTVVGHAEDLDVSATKYAPWERPQLGDWLNNRADEFDVIVFYRLDRFVRSVSDFAKMIDWCEEHDKGLISATEPFDLLDPMGRAMAQIIAVFAELEAATIAARVKSAREHLRNKGNVGGGAAPFGYVNSKTDNGVVWGLDPQHAPVMREMVQMAIAGNARRPVAEWLQEQGIPTPQDLAKIRRGEEPKGAIWQATTVGKLLESPNLLGQSTHKGEIIRGDDGMPIQFGEPLIDRQKWEELQDVLKRTANPHSGKRSNASMLLSVAYCACGQPLYFDRQSGGRKPRYMCASRNKPGMKACGFKQIHAEKLEEIMSDALMAELANRERQRKVIIPGEDHTEDLEQTKLAIDALVKSMELARSESVLTRLLKQIEALDERAARLEKMPQVPARIEWQGTGETFGDHWATLHRDARGRLLRDSKVRLTVLNHSDVREITEENADMPQVTMEGIAYAFGPGTGPAELHIEVDLGDLREMHKLTRH